MAYVDGFNFYHGLMSKGWGRYRWPDPAARPRLDRRPRRFRQAFSDEAEDLPDSIASIASIAIASRRNFASISARSCIIRSGGSPATLEAIAANVAAELGTALLNQSCACSGRVAVTSATHASISRWVGGG